MVLSDDFYYQPIRLDTINTQIYTDLIAKEGDAGGRGLKVTITENGVTKNTTGITLNLKWEHTAVADLQGLDPFEAVDLTKGIYKLKYPTNMLHKGAVKALIQIIDNGGLAGSRNLKIKVDSTVGDDTAMESSNEFRALASALVEVQGWNDRIDDVEQDFIDRANNLDATYPTRLVSVEQQLAQTGRDVSIIGIEKVGGGKLATMSDLGQDVKTAMTGGSVAVVGKGAVTEDTIVDKQVTIPKLGTDVVKTISRNLLNPSDYTVGGYYDLNGKWQESDTYVSSNIIPVEQFETVTRDTDSGQGFTVDENGEYIGPIDVIGTFNIAPNYFIKGMRLVVNRHRVLENYVVRGDKPLRTVHQLGDTFVKDISPDKVDYIEPELNENLITPTGMTSGGYYDATTGNWVVDNLHSTSNFITVENGELIAKDTGSGQYSYWDSKRNWLRGENGLGGASTIKIPNDPEIDSVRFTIVNSKQDAYARRESSEEVEKFKLDEDKFIISPKSLDYVETIPVDNLIDFDNLLINEYYQFITGEKIPSDLTTASNLITVSPGEDMYTHTGSGQKTYWDSSGNWLGGNDVDGAFKVPDLPGITHMRVNISAGMLNEGKALVVRGSEIPREKFRFPSNRFIFGEEKKPEDDLTFIKPFSRVTNPVITKEIVTDREGVSSVADPFIINENGRYHMFFEVISSTGDEIGHAYSEDLINWAYTEIILPLATGHRSAYPNVFKVENDWYMLPDAGWQCNLYKATNFPTDWAEINPNLLPNTGGYNDTNIFFVSGKWYLTTSQFGEGIDVYVNNTGDFTNSEWIFVKKVIGLESGLTGVRGAGNPVVYDGYILMPVQYSQGGVYGRFTRLYKLSNFGNENFTATNLGILTKNQDNGKWNSKSMHHISNAPYRNERIFAVDGTDENNEYTIGLYVEE